jgi:hypothetical protein
MTISISNAILRKYGAKHASRLLRESRGPAALSAAEAIPQEIGREVMIAEIF